MYKKNNSPNKFLGGIAASAMSGGSGGSGGYSGSLRDAINNSSGGGILGNIARALSGRGGGVSNEQSNQASNVASNLEPGTGASMSMSDGLGDKSNPLEGQKFELTPVQMKDDSYIPGNEQGNAKPLFSNQTKQLAYNMFGQQIPGTFGSALAKKNCNKKY